MFAFLDTPFDPDFPVYTTANAGEILPDPLPPLAWSVVGPAIEEGFRIAFCDDFGVLDRPGPDRPFQAVGRMAGRLHLNLSVLHISAADSDDDRPEVASHAAAGGRLLLRLRKTPAVGKTLAGLGRRVNRDRTLADELAATVARSIDGTDGEPGEGGAGPVGDLELVRLLRSAVALYGRTLGTHVTAEGLIVPMAEQARSALRRAEITDGDAERLLTEIPDLESERPVLALVELGQSVPRDTEAGAVVFGGSWAALGSSDDAGVAAFRKSAEGFLDEFGHWGPAGFDPTVPAWTQDPDAMLARLAALAADPPVAPEPLDLDPGRLARPLVAAARSAMARAERTRDTMMRSTDVVRRLLFDLRDRLADRIDPELFWCTTLAELETVACGGAAPVAAELERRREDYAAACAFVPADRSDGRLLAADDLDEGPGVPPPAA